MDLNEQFPPNENSTPGRKRPTDIQPVSKARRPKTSTTKSFFGGETANQIKSYLISDVLVPAFKDTVEEAVLGLLDNILHPDTPSSGRNMRSNSYRGNERIRYDQFGKRSNLRSVGVSDSRESPEDYNDFVYASRGEAEVTLRRLYDIISKYRVASVYDYYKLNGVTGEWSTDKYGWDIDSFPDPRSFGKVRNVRGGYSIILPRVSVIE